MSITSREWNAAATLGHVKALPEGRHQACFHVADAHCAACIRRIEGCLLAQEGMEIARLNLTTKRLLLVWKGGATQVDVWGATLDSLGFSARAYSPETANTTETERRQEWLKALAVAFFANSNVMMLSWAVWAGHFGAMGEATRSLFHWLSALIALPAILYAGRPFFRSAFHALRRRATNMDVPIAAGVVLTTGMSLSETIRGGPHIYFDGALSLLFVLLLGRTLDAHLRQRARSGVETLAAMLRQPVARQNGDGSLSWLLPEDVRPGDRVVVAMGERIGIDGIIVEGMTSLDTSLINGESLPRDAALGSSVHAGMINLGQTILIQALEPGGQSTLAEMVRLMEAAEQRKGRYVAFADRVVSHYTPVVHTLALLTLVGWLFATDFQWHIALVHAVSVLIIACPCALGLAVPVTQIVAASRAMKAGILLKSETALERLASVNQVAFDKTGTLSTGLKLANAASLPHEALAIASGMAASSRHPIARAIRAAKPDAAVVPGVEERPGAGLSWQGPEGLWQLGSARMLGLPEDTTVGAWLKGPVQPALPLRIDATPRDGTKAALELLVRQGYSVSLLSGDQTSAVKTLAKDIGLVDWYAGATPIDKADLVAGRARDGQKVLMVGDGINDAPAMAAAAASMAPAEATDLSLRQADLVFLHPSLMAVPRALLLARASQRIVRQNIAFSFVYNAIWVPVAMAGMVTPWIAALAMSASSIFVTLNALRLHVLPLCTSAEEP
jgi:Cu2+-exporting ATPase